MICSGEDFFFLKTGSIRLWLGVIEFVICSTFLGKGKNFQRRHKQNTRNWNEKKICSSKKCENVKVGSVFGIENVPIRFFSVFKYNFKYKYYTFLAVT